MSRLSEKTLPLGLIAAALAAVALMAAGCSGGGGERAQEGPAKSAAGAATASRPAAADLVQGKEIYLRHCHFCHGQKGYGDGPVGIALSPHPANFVGDRKRMAKTDEELYESITEGIHREIGGDAMSMPRWREILTDDERWNVLAYIRQLEQEGLKAAQTDGEAPSGVTGEEDAR